MNASSRVTFTPSSRINHQYLLTVQWNLSWATTAMRDHLSWYFLQKVVYLNVIEPVTRDHLSWETFLQQMGWSSKTGSTVSWLCCTMHMHITFKTLESSYIDTKEGAFWWIDCVTAWICGLFRLVVSQGSDLSHHILHHRNMVSLHMQNLHMSLSCSILNVAFFIFLVVQKNLSGGLVTPQKIHDSSPLTVDVISKKIFVINCLDFCPWEPTIHVYM